jgi:hypothetical protein
MKSESESEIFRNSHLVDGPCSNARWKELALNHRVGSAFKQPFFGINNKRVQAVGSVAYSNMDDAGLGDAELDDGGGLPIPTHLQTSKSAGSARKLMQDMEPEPDRLRSEEKVGGRDPVHAYTTCVRPILLA